MAQTLYTDLVTLIVAAWLNDVDAATYNTLSAVAGTNTITATGPTTVTAYAANQRFFFIPAATNTGATTLNISSIGAKNIFSNGAACVGGELKISVPVEILYDGTQFNIIGSGLSGFANQSANTFLSGPTSGAAAAPAFRAPVGADGASLVLLGTASASSSATVDFTSVITNTYDSYLITLTDVAPANDAVNLNFRASTDNGVSFLSTNEYYTAGVSVDAATQTVSGRGGAALSALSTSNNVGNGSNQVTNGTIKLQRSSGKRCAIEYDVNFVQSGGGIFHANGSGYVAANSINAIRFVMSTGNIASGDFAIWGMRKA